MFDFASSDFLAALEEACEEYGWSSVGVRIQEEDHPFRVGPIDHVSHVWVDGDETDEDLPGVCCLYAAADYIPTLVRNAPAYFWPGRHVAIITGDVVEFGEDPGEVIMSNAEVVHVAV